MSLTHIYHDYDDEYLNFNLTISQKYWSELFPAGGGLVGLGEEEAAKMGLHTSIQGKSDPSKHVYLIAAFHQLFLPQSTPLDNDETVPRPHILNQRSNLPPHNALCRYCAPESDVQRGFDSDLQGSWRVAG
ncbi:hypothetical protein VTL71DRAFT_13747 [Oculimacula yallundae]|uniref:Uncharacterized protein n=1 Tax=Oculimacula yallundae TaxID=86028 RepID=A0ABR4CL97_9HELO